MNSTSVSFCTIRLLHNTQVNIWVSWKATSDGWTVYCKSSVVIKVCFSSSSVICFKELPYTKSIAISIWIQSVTRFIESCIFNRCTIRIWNNWVSIDATSSACWDWSQLSRNCWCAINNCISFETCRLQGYQHVIYWLVQAWALLSIWWSIFTRISWCFFCWQFSLNFSNSLFDSSFLLFILMGWSIFFCYLIQ